jgi:hypothetical protein
MSEMGPFACAADLPDGQIAHACHAQIARRANLSQPDGIAVTPKSAADFAPSRPHQEGRLAIVTDVGRDAVDAVAAQDGRGRRRTAKSCGPDAPTLVSSLRMIEPQATVAKEPGHRGEHEISR